MNTNNLSSCILIDKIEETKDFYIKYFDAKIIFDCGWYLNLEFGSKKNTLQFMMPQQPEQPKSNGAGLIYNFEVEDVNYENQRLLKAGLKETMPLDDHPWGDRGFAVSDPNGVTLYVYSQREPSEEFKKYYK